MELDKKTIKKIILILFAAIIFYLGVKNMNEVIKVLGSFFSLISPFIIGAMIAFIINVPMSRIEEGIFGEKKVRGKRIISFVITLALIIGIIAVAMYIIIPQIASTLQSIAGRLPAAYTSAEAWIADNMSYLETLGSENSELAIDWDGLVGKIVSFLQQSASSMVDNGIGAISNIISAIVNFCIGFVFAVYILFAKEKLTRQGKQIIFALFKEETADKILYVCTLSQRTFSRFISGQCLEACILGFMFFVTMSIFRMPYAMLISVFIAFCALIPIVGAFIGCFLGILLILIVDPLKAVIFVVMFLVLQQIEGNFVYPHVVGNSVGLPSIWVLCAVTIGGKLMGVIGMVVFIPFVSVIYSLFRLYVKSRLEKKEVPSGKWTEKLELGEDVMVRERAGK